MAGGLRLSEGVFSMSEFHRLSAKSLQGQEIPMQRYAGKVVLIVNTASKCGLTPQYEGLQKLHEKYADAGLVVLGFPCNQFGSQEPGNEEEISAFCESNYGVTFPIFAKVDVKGAGAHPVFRYLCDRLPGFLGKAVKWNFTKFLIGRDGTPLKRFAPVTRPEKVEATICGALRE
jgi:glutathione peroxidase